MKTIVAVTPQDDPADILEAYGREVYERMYPDCKDCGMKFEHTSDCEREKQ